LVPSFNNDLVVSSINVNEYIVLMSDENGFVGDNIYYLITRYFWWAIPMLAFCSVVLSLGKSLTRSSSGR
jgi:hypothetical protein